MKSFYDLQFKYCPLIWMCHRRTYNCKIKRSHVRCPRIICNDKQSPLMSYLKRIALLPFLKETQMLATDITNPK